MRRRGNWFPAIALVVALVGTAWATLWARPGARRAAVATAAQSRPQSHTPEWQTAAGGKMAFESASVKQNTSPPSRGTGSSFPLGPGDVYIPNGGFFRATNFPLANYILFAYKITPSQEQSVFSQLPNWAKTDRFDIEARAEGNPTKDQMRLMMQALLADRFRLQAHYETRQVPVFALLVNAPGRLGPLLQKHPEGSQCPATPMVPSPPPTAPPQEVDSRFPETRGGIMPMTPSAPGRLRGGARNVTMELIASSMTGGGSGVDRPVVDKTGLEGRFDVAIEVSPQYGAGLPPNSNFPRDPSGPTFAEALRDQLGLRLEPQMDEVNFLIIDYIEQPLRN